MYKLLIKSILFFITISTCSPIVAKPLSRNGLVKYLNFNDTLNKYFEDSTIDGIFFNKNSQINSAHSRGIKSNIAKLKFEFSLLTLPIISAGNDVSICQNQSTVIGSSNGASGGTAPYTYSWYPVYGISDTASSLTIAYPPVTTSYILTVKDALGNIAKDTVIVTVMQMPLPPTINISGNSNICQGDSTTLVSTTPSGGVFFYDWYKSGSFVTRIFNNPNYRVGVSGQYRVSLVDVFTSCRSFQSNQISITGWSSFPSIVNASSSTSFCQGDSVILTASGGNSYLWSNGFTTSSIIVKTSGSYSVQAFNSGCINLPSSQIITTLKSSPNMGVDKTVYHNCVNETTNLWSLFDTTGLISNWNTLLPALAPPNNYRLIVTNNVGCKDTVLANVLFEIATWIGASNSNWHLASNWNIGKVPTSVTHVIIPPSTLNMCVLDNPNLQAVAASVQIANGAIVTINNNCTISVNGNCAVLPNLFYDTVTLIRKLNVYYETVPGGANLKRILYFDYDNLKRVNTVRIKNYGYGFDSGVVRFSYTLNQPRPSRIISPNSQLSQIGIGTMVYDTTYFFYNNIGLVTKDSGYTIARSGSNNWRQLLLRNYKYEPNNRTTIQLSEAPFSYNNNSVFVSRKDTVDYKLDSTFNKIKVTYSSFYSSLTANALLSAFNYSTTVNPLSKLNISGLHYNWLITPNTIEILGNTNYKTVDNSNILPTYLDFASPRIPNLFYNSNYNTSGGFLSGDLFSIEIIPSAVRNNYPSVIKVTGSSSYPVDKFIYEYTY
jgi:hypothetical protein